MFAGSVDGGAEMSKPEWKDAPEWANYFAQDPCGTWYWFELKPEAVGDWVEGSTHGRIELAKQPQLEWHTTLEPRP